MQTINALLRLKTHMSSPESLFDPNPELGNFHAQVNACDGQRIVSGISLEDLEQQVNQLLNVHIRFHSTHDSPLCNIIAAVFQKGPEEWTLIRQLSIAPSQEDPSRYVFSLE